jgi:insertion element IS1 protein InsB
MDFNLTEIRVIDVVFVKRDSSLTISIMRTRETDRLKNYRYLIDEKLHSVKSFGTNHIERKNLTLRTHLKRLNRRTICFSRGLIMLISILKIYFWL